MFYLLPKNINYCKKVSPNDNISKFPEHMGISLHNRMESSFWMHEAI